MFRISLRYPLIDLLQHDGKESIRFFKISLPFGQLSIQFGDSVISDNDQASSCLEEHILTKAVETPTLGYESPEEAPPFLPLFTKLHWASDIISVDILEFLMNAYAPAMVTA